MIKSGILDQKIFFVITHTDFFFQRGVYRIGADLLLELLHSSPIYIDPNFSKHDYIICPSYTKKLQKAMAVDDFEYASIDLH